MLARDLPSSPAILPPVRCAVAITRADSSCPRRKRTRAFAMEQWESFFFDIAPALVTPTHALMTFGPPATTCSITWEGTKNDASERCNAGKKRRPAPENGSFEILDDYSIAWPQKRLHTSPAQIQLYQEGEFCNGHSLRLWQEPG